MASFCFKYVFNQQMSNAIATGTDTLPPMFFLLLLLLYIIIVGDKCNKIRMEMEKRECIPSAPFLLGFSSSNMHSPTHNGKQLKWKWGKYLNNDCYLCYCSSFMRSYIEVCTPVMEMVQQVVAVGGGWVRVAGWLVGWLAGVFRN